MFGNQQVSVTNGYMEKVMLIFFDDKGREIRFSDKEFVSCELAEYYQRIDNYTLELLMMKLPAEEMIEYLKDNGLNVCPIAR